MISKFRKSLKKLTFMKDFPSKIVREAYISPKLERLNKDEKFRWGWKQKTKQKKLKTKTGLLCYY